MIPPHSHHAIQIVIAIDGEMAIKGARGDWRSGRGVIVRHDAEHSYDGKGALGAMIFVDPESVRRGVAADLARRGHHARSRGANQRLRGSLSTFVERPFESMEIGDLIRHCVHSLCPGAPPARRLDERVTKVLTAIQAQTTCGCRSTMPPPWRSCRRAASRICSSSRSACRSGAICCGAS